MLRTRLVEEDRYHVWRRIGVFVGLTWLPLLILSALQGALADSNTQIPFLRDPGPYARYLIALPLLVVLDVIIDPLLATVVQHLETSGVLPEEERSRYRGAILKMSRLRDSVWVEVALIALAVIMSWSVIPGYGEVRPEPETSSWIRAVTSQGEWLTFAGWWYLLVSAPFLQLLLYRWGWRFAIWVAFLRRFSGIRLTIQPSHPDLAGGLGMLYTGQLAFGVMSVAVATMMSSTLGDDILYKGQTLASVIPQVIGFVLISVAVIVAPLFMFLGQLMRAKRLGLREYGVLGSRLAQAFHAKWVSGISAQQSGGLMDTADASAMADYNAAYETVSHMRLVPIKLRSTIVLALALVAPFLPLTLTEISITEILKRIAQSLV
jgi:hypothetical protein